MKNRELYLHIEKILDDWDPIGIQNIIKQKSVLRNGVYGEYTGYVEPIIATFLQKKSVYDYLVKLFTDLHDDPNEDEKEEIKIVATEIIDFLSEYYKDRE